MGGDGWAYDIGYGGLDHVLSSTATSTCWCSTPRSTRTPAASSRRRRRWAPRPSSPSAGKESAKKDLGLMAMGYGHVYVARVAFGAKDAQTRASAFQEAESLPRALADHRLQPLHRPRLRHGLRRRAAEAGGRLGRLAALPLRPAPRGARRAAARARLGRAEDLGRAVHAERGALPHGREARPGALQAAARGGASAQATQRVRGVRAARRPDRAADRGRRAAAEAAEPPAEPSRRSTERRETWTSAPPTSASSCRTR